YQNATWYGFLAPAKTPAPVLQTLHDAIVAVGADPELKEKIRAQGITPRSIGLRDFDAHIRKDMDRLEPLLQTIAPSNYGDSFNRAGRRCAFGGKADDLRTLKPCRV